LGPHAAHGEQHKDEGNMSVVFLVLRAISGGPMSVISGHSITPIFGHWWSPAGASAGGSIG
jgi:hypothetical protein